MARRHTMAAIDSVTGDRYAWVAKARPAWDGAGYPGPNEATDIQVVSSHDDGLGEPGDDYWISEESGIVGTDDEGSALALELDPTTRHKIDVGPWIEEAFARFAAKSKAGTIHLPPGHVVHRKPIVIDNPRSYVSILGAGINATKLISDYTHGPKFLISHIGAGINLEAEVPPGSGLTQSWRSDPDATEPRFWSLSSCGGAFDFGGQGNFTWQCAVRFNGTTAAGKSVWESKGKWACHAEASEQTVTAFSITYTHSTGRLVAKIRTNLDNEIAVAATLLPDTWYRLAVTVTTDLPGNLTTLKLYVNGVIPDVDAENSAEQGNYLKQEPWENYTIGAGFTFAGHQLLSAGADFNLAWFSTCAKTLNSSEIQQDFTVPPLQVGASNSVHFDPIDTDPADPDSNAQRNFGVDTSRSPNQLVRFLSSSSGQANAGWLHHTYAGIGLGVSRVTIGRLTCTSSSAASFTNPDNSTRDTGCTSIFANSALDFSFHDIDFSDFGGVWLSFDGYDTKGDRFRLGARRFGIFGIKNVTLSRFCDVFCLSGHLMALFTGNVQMESWRCDSSNADHMIQLNGGGQFASSYLLEDCGFGVENHVTGDVIKTQLLITPGVYSTDVTMINCGFGHITHIDDTPIKIVLDSSGTLKRLIMLGGAVEMPTFHTKPVITYEGATPQPGTVITRIRDTYRWAYGNERFHKSGSGPEVHLDLGSPFRASPLLDLPYGLYIKIDLGGVRGTATFKWSLNGGLTYEETGVTTAATYELPRTGITIAFDAGTYVLNEVYRYHGWVDPDVSGQVGLTTISKPSRMPAHVGVYRGEVTFADAETSKAVPTFPALASNDYHVHLNMIDASSGAVVGHYYTTLADRTTTGLTIRSTEAPGTGETVTIAWSIEGYEDVF